MNPNAKFLNEAKAITARWAKTGVLDGIDKKYDRAATAILMECQRLHNETGTWDCCDDCREREKSNFKRVKATVEILEAKT